MFDLDWSDRDAVITYAKRLGSGMTVIKMPMRSNYNIIHTANLGRYADASIVYQTHASAYDNLMPR